MATGPTYATFANTLVSKGFDFTLAPGVPPSVCMLYSVPHVANLPNVGTLTIKTDGGPTFAFRDCLVESPSMTASLGGQYVTLPVKDRRWKWQFGAMYGHWNKPNANGTYTRERTPQQLASMIFAELGEIGADWSRLPNNQRPEKHWDGANPAAELDALCNELGCLVVLNPIADRAEIWPVGDGGTLPLGGALGRAHSPVIPATPQKIAVQGGNTIFQATWTCEAVGLDTDGKWKPQNQLSYLTTGVSGSAALNGFEGYWEGQTYLSDGKTLNVRDLAAATLFRCYRIKNIPSWLNGVVPPVLSGSYYQPSTLKDLRFSDTLATEEISPIDGGLRPQPAVVYAQYARLDKPTLTAPIRYPDGYSFDPEQNIITFPEPLFLWSNNTNASNPANVFFECSFYAGNNGVYHRHTVESPTGSTVVTPTHVIARPEIQRRVLYSFTADGHAVGTNDSLTDTTGRLNYWLQAALGQYGLQDGGTITYPGLIAIAPDGLTLQVTWSGGGTRLTTTTASQAQRHNRYIKPLDEYRDRLTIKRQETIVQQLAVGQLLKAMGGGL